ncbi:MAG: hypothetical protein ACWIPJ_02685 [Polaribacter sp.]
MTKIICGTLVLFSLVFIIESFIKWRNSKKDLKENIKISETLKISNKYILGGFNNSTIRYFIILESNKIKRYELKQDVYEVVQINDFIEIEYSKCACWILKIEHNGKNIANKDVLN